MVRILSTTDPFDYRSTSLAHINGDGGGIPQTVGLAVSSNNESKPIWLCVQAFEGGNWLMPSVCEMRGQLYTGIVSGSTGFIYFASECTTTPMLASQLAQPLQCVTRCLAPYRHVVDSYVTRAGDVFGISPRQLGNETYFDSSTTDPKPPASPSLLALAAELWDGVAQLNSELLSLMPVIFAPTSAHSAALSVSFSGSNTTDTPIRAMWKTLPDGSEYLIAVNVDVSEVK
eukprot:COSAG02_NODE_1339_length_13187_cov_610.871027_9_plen_230_part_00